MGQVKVMISRFYRGGVFTDERTHTSFNPSKDEGRVFTFSKTMDLQGIGELIKKNHLIPVDKQTADLFQEIGRDIKAESPQVVEIRYKTIYMEVVFDRPVYPVPNKTITVETKSGEVTIQATDAYMENHATAVYAIDAIAKPLIQDGAFVDDDGLLYESTKEKETQKELVEEKVEEATVEIPVEEVIEAPVKKQTRRTKAKKESQSKQDV